MASNKLTCPFCGNKDAFNDNGLYSSHAEGDNESSQCVMSGRPVQGQSDRAADGPAPK